MNGWAIGALLTGIYAVAVGGLALKKSSGLIKIVKMKMGKKMTDEGAIKLSLVMAAIMTVACIVFIVLAATKG